MGPLEGIKIIDMTSGPYATQTLRDMGADVIKVEAPDGDVTRQIGPPRNPGMGAIFLNPNRSKRSICLDLKQEAGREAHLRLATDAGVCAYNIRPQAMRRLGLGYETLAAINPRLVYAGLFGFGQDGPYAAKPAYDDVIQGAAVMSSLIARAGDGTPRYVPSAVADRVVGWRRSARSARRWSTVTEPVSASRSTSRLFETMVGFVLGDHLGGQTFEPPISGGGYARQLSPDRRPNRTGDGHVCALIYRTSSGRASWRRSARPTCHGPTRASRTSPISMPILDLEDSNALDAKEAARRETVTMRQAPRDRQKLFVRINAFDTAFSAARPRRGDAASAGRYALPKCDGPEQVERLAHILDALEAAHGIAPGRDGGLALRPRSVP